jgi:glycosyltransferase involved in cell wall biosynthesis
MAKVLGAGSVCGVDLDRYRFKSETRSQMRQQLGIPKEAFAILFIGRMVKDKGIIELSHAFKNIAAKNLNTYLIFVGPDEDGLAEHALQILKNVSEQCRFIGYTNETEKYIATADVLCLPSYREGFPIVILEAAAMQVPSIGSDIYGVSDAILDRETGLLFKAGSVVDLERVIELMINDEHLRLKLGRSAYARVCSQFESDLVVSSYLEFFTNLMKITLKV